MLLEQLTSLTSLHHSPLTHPRLPRSGIQFKLQRVLIIDDDPDVIRWLSMVLTGQDHLKVFTASDPFEAMSVLQHQVIDTIILDWYLPVMTGPEVLLRTEEILSSDPDTPLEWDHKKTNVIFFTIMEKKEIRSMNSEHFRYTGYIAKTKSNEHGTMEKVLGILNRHQNR